MKGAAGKTPDFRVSLSDEAKRIITIAKDKTPNDFIFANHKGNILSDAAMSSIMKRAGIDARPHGFRSTLRTCLSAGERGMPKYKPTGSGNGFGNLFSYRLIFPLLEAFP